jgi:hypothetical protein
MDEITLADVKQLAKQSHEYCVSIYMPTHRVGREVEQGPIRFRNLLRLAEEQLLAAGQRQPDAREILAPGENLLSDSVLWQHQSDGLTVFLTPEDMVYYRLALNFEEFVYVGRVFYLKPLFPSISAETNFFVLALSQKAIKLLECTDQAINEIDLEDTPTNMVEALQLDEPQRGSQFHTGASGSGSGGTRTAMFHGQGSREEDSKKDILRFFHLVDDGMSKVLRGEQVPLVLAGVEYLLSLYQEANTYPNLVENGLVGNPEGISEEILCARAREILQPLFDRAQQRDADRIIQHLKGKSQLASADLNEIITAAYQGRVETIFVPLDLHRWGSYDLPRSTFTEHDEFQFGDQDLLDRAAVQTFLTGGRVYSLISAQIPGELPAAAMFRY